MTGFIAKLMAFFMSIVYFFGSFGLGTNDPVTINVSDAQGEPVSGAVVYFLDESEYDIVVYTLIGTTDENGNVEWEDQKYGEQSIIVSLDDDSGEALLNGQNFTVTVSRTQNETIYLTIE